MKKLLAVASLSLFALVVGCEDKKAPMPPAAEKAKEGVEKAAKAVKGEKKVAEEKAKMAEKKAKEDSGW